jgi:hypothetical protein
MGCAQAGPTTVGGLSFEHQHGHNRSALSGNLVDVVEELPEAKADLLVLAGAAQALDLGDVDTSATSPSSVKLGAAAPGLPDLYLLATEVSDQRTDCPLMCRRGGIDLVPIHPERVAMGVLRRAARLEWLAKDSVAHLPHDADLTGTALQAPAWGLSTGKQVAEPVSVHHMDMSTLPAGLLSADEFAAVAAVRIDDPLAGEVTMDQQHHL